MIINFHQTSFSYTAVGNTTLEFSGAQSVPVNEKGKGKQITGTFSITTACKCFTLGRLNATILKAIQHLDNIIISYFEVMREELGLPEDQNVFSFMMFSKLKQ